MGNINADVLSVSGGLKNYTEVDMVRIKSEKYTLLIMRDYMPVIGEVRGDVDLVIGDETCRFEDIQGYFTHTDNHFTLLINEVWDVK
ncbi:MAG: hypothetical protein LUE90_06685 [Clostridiales bacterium]|nr:hypothetical protein [Clostridiales bacterium]